MIEFTTEPIDSARLLAAVTDAHCGAEVLFVGTTRRWTKRDDTVLETEHLFYEAHRELALVHMQELAAQAAEHWPVQKVAIVHRLGRVEPEEASVGVAVSTPHRSEAFQAAEWLMNRVKHEVPIWKQEHYVQNGKEWIHPSSGSCSCNASSPPTASLQPSNKQDGEYQAERP